MPARRSASRARHERGRRTRPRRRRPAAGKAARAGQIGLAERPDAARAADGRRLSSMSRMTTAKAGERPDAPRAMPASRTNSIARTSSVARESPTPTARAITARCWKAAISSGVSARVDGGAEPGVQAIDRAIAGGEAARRRARARPQPRRHARARARPGAPSRAPPPTTSAIDRLRRSMPTSTAASLSASADHPLGLEEGGRDRARLLLVDLDLAVELLHRRIVDQRRRPARAAPRRSSGWRRLSRRTTGARK